MAVDSRAKGSRTETQVKDILKKYTELAWERVPMSGALDPIHGLKADLYVPNALNIFAVEVKGYAEDHLCSKLLTSTNPEILKWWSQCTRQAKQINKKPLLIFKFDRSKMFVAYEEIPNFVDHMYIFIKDNSFYVSLLEDWLKLEKVKFI